VSGDLRHARVMFIVHGLDGPALERVRQGLDHASGYFRSAIARRLRTKASPAVIFEVDQVFDKAMRVEAILRELGPAVAPKPAAPDPDPAEVDAKAADEPEAGK
jgi:ribosome-binding factor A